MKVLCEYPEGRLLASTNGIKRKKKKERFLSLFLRYEQAKDFKKKSFAREALDEYIEKFIDESDRFESTIGVGKGAGKQTTINFPDKTSWIVPPDFRSAKLE